MNIQAFWRRTPWRAPSMSPGFGPADRTRSFCRAGSGEEALQNWLRRVTAPRSNGTSTKRGPPPIVPPHVRGYDHRPEGHTFREYGPISKAGTRSSTPSTPAAARRTTGSKPSEADHAGGCSPHHRQKERGCVPRPGRGVNCALRDTSGWWCQSSSSRSYIMERREEFSIFMYA